jgi:hypothetical protein
MPYMRRVSSTGVRAVHAGILYGSCQSVSAVRRPGRNCSLQEDALHHLTGRSKVSDGPRRMDADAASIATLERLCVSHCLLHAGGCCCIQPGFHRICLLLPDQRSRYHGNTVSLAHLFRRYMERRNGMI